MKIVTWNINSVRSRLNLLARLAREFAPDVICLQETKAPDDKFPAADIAAMGYSHQALKGMKMYNGVAILARAPFAFGGAPDWCGREDCRHVWVRLDGGAELHNFYVPAGGDVPDRDANDKFGHKLDFLTAMADWGAQAGRTRTGRILVGDLNVAPLPADVWSHKQLLKVVSHTPIEVAHLTRAQTAGNWTDAVRAHFGDDAPLYSWWSYRAKDWRASDRGRRLDHVWLSPPLAGKIKRVDILKDCRDWEKASDHAPIMIELRA